MDTAPDGVEVECYVDFVKISNTDTVSESVPVQFYINVLWRDDRHPNGNTLGYKTPEEAADNASDAPESAWRPLISCSNVENDWAAEASPVTCGYREPSRSGAHNLNMFMFYRCVGTISNPMTLHKFPFDTDTIEGACCCGRPLSLAEASPRPGVKAPHAACSMGATQCTWIQARPTRRASPRSGRTHIRARQGSRTSTPRCCPSRNPTSGGSLTCQACARLQTTASRAHSCASTCARTLCLPRRRAHAPPLAAAGSSAERARTGIARAIPSSTSSSRSSYWSS